VSEGDRERHQFGGIVARIAKHEALVTGTDVFALIGVVIDTHCNVRALAIERHHNVAAIAVDTPFIVGISDINDRFANDVCVVHDRLGGDFSDNQRETGCNHGFASDTARGVLRQESVEDTVRNAVRQFVWVTHGNRFTCENILA